MSSKGLVLVVCAAALVLSAACSKAPDDNTIANDIKAKIFSNPDLKTLAVDVTVKDGVVTLAGEVPSAEAQLALYKLAQATPGVQKVEDKLTLPGQLAAEAPPVTEQQAAAPAPAAPSAQPAAGTAPRASAPSRPAVQPAAPPERGAAPPAGPVTSVAPSAPSAPAATQPVTVEIPAGTRFSLRMTDAIDSAKNKTGELFLAVLDEPVPLKGTDVIPKGTDIYVKLAEAKSAGRISGSSELELQLNKMEFQGKTYPLVSNSYEEKGKSRGKETATRVGIGAGVGAAIGAIAGGGKGAAIGAAIGGGGATALQVFTRGKQVKVPSETLLDFQLQAPVAVTYLPASQAVRTTK
ncbi:MAG: BON domain-containing protein [Acidobacteria bacterium]|nr:BON domain-containing protein [Acidobacteriota bacterium]